MTDVGSGHEVRLRYSTRVCLRGVDVHLVDGTYELFRHFYAVPSARDARRPRSGRRARRARLGARHARRRRHAHRRGHRSRDRVVPQRTCGPATRPATASTRRCWSQFPLLEEVLTALRRDGVADGGVRGRRRAGVGRGARPRATRACDAGAHLHARQGPGAVRARHARRAARSPARARSATKPASSPSSACRRHRFPTTWRSSATAPTAIRACRAGAPSRRPRCWRASATSRRFPTTTARGAST